MSLAESIDYRSELEEERSRTIFETYLENTNAHFGPANFDYLITEENGNEYVTEFSQLNGNISARRALVADDLVIEGVLAEEKVEELKEEYDWL